MKNNGTLNWGQILERLGNPPRVVHDDILFIVDYSGRELLPEGIAVEGRPDFDTIPFVLGKEYPAASDDIFPA